MTASNILTVGTGKEFSSIAAAVAAAQNGDTILVNAGTYTNDFVDTTKSLSLQAVGGVVDMRETVSPPDGKGMITEGLNGGTFSITGFDIEGVTVSSGNGAGVRYQGGTLTLNNDNFSHDQDGLLANPAPTGAITINNCEFGFDGTGDGRTHDLYVNNVATLTITNSYFHDSNEGLLIKSRASNTIIQNNRLFSNNSPTSGEIEIANGGNATIIGNIIEQGANTTNPYFVDYGLEGISNSGTNVVVSNNTLINYRTAHSAYAVVNANPNAILQFTDNRIYGLNPSTQLDSPASTGTVAVSGTTILTTAPALDTSSDWQPSATSSGSGSTSSGTGSSAGSGGGTVSAPPTGTGSSSSGGSPSPGGSSDGSSSGSGTVTAPPSGMSGGSNGGSSSAQSDPTGSGAASAPPADDSGTSAPATPAQPEAPAQQVFNIPADQTYAPLSVSNVQVNASGTHIIAATGSNDNFSLAGADATVLTGNGNSITGSGQVQLAYISGSHNVLDFSAATASAIVDSGSSNTIVLPAGGGTPTLLFGNELSNGDIFDFRYALAHTDWKGDAGSLASYLAVRAIGPNLGVFVSNTASGSASMVALFAGGGAGSASTVLTHAIV